MREVKFRGKSTLNGEWHVGDFITDTKEFNRTCDKAYILPRWNKLNAPIQVHKETIGQFTGLRDKNGKEIYDKDIVDFTHKTINGGLFSFKCRVFQKENGSWWIEGKDESGYKTSQELYCNKKHCEVIGNIYENPELLEGGQ